jgi:tetratricopeptide (TPR) repeat protein
MKVERDEVEEALAMIAEAWELSGAEGWDGERGDVHAVVVAHIGKATLHLRLGQYKEAVDFAERGVAIADRYGLVASSIHRLLPVLGEALLWLGAYDRVQEVADRLERESEAFGHEVGKAFAFGLRALLSRFRDKAPDAFERMEAAELMERHKRMLEAARLRFNTAQLLVMAGRGKEGVQQYRKAYRMFDAMGAKRERRLVGHALRGLKATVPTAPRQEKAKLTPLLRKIGKLISKGLRDRQIAEKINKSYGATRNAVSDLRKMLKVTRAELADLAKGW